jgi:hypothetical protein
LTCFFVFGTVWAVFRTRGSGPNGGDPVVTIHGPVRVGMELPFCLAAAWEFWASGQQVAAVLLVIGATAIYLATRERITNLLPYERH